MRSVLALVETNYGSAYCYGWRGTHIALHRSVKHRDILVVSVTQTDLEDKNVWNSESVFDFTILLWCSTVPRMFYRHCIRNTFYRCIWIAESGIVMQIDRDKLVPLLRRASLSRLKAIGPFSYARGSFHM